MRQIEAGREEVAGNPFLAVIKVDLSRKDRTMSDLSRDNGANHVWEPDPAQQGMAHLPGGRIWYWDTGGAAPAVVFVHPNAGSGISWEHQYETFRGAGFRVIGYSRRNYYKSDLADVENPGIASVDLRDLATFLGLEPFHLVAVAAGGGVATDFALSFPDSLLSTAERFLASVAE